MLSAVPFSPYYINQSRLLVFTQKRWIKLSSLKLDDLMMAAFFDIGEEVFE